MEQGGGRGLSGLSDDELVAAMRVHVDDGRWPIIQLLEVEDRGLESLASDPELQAAVVEHMDEWSKRHQEMIAKALPDLSRFVGASFEPPSWAGALSDVFTDPAVFVVPLDSPQARHEELISALGEGFHVSATAVGGVADEVRTLTTKSPPRWIAYVVLVASVLGALAGVAGVALAIAGE